MLRKQLRKPAGAKSRRNNEIETLTVFGNANAATVVADVEELVEEAQTMIVDLRTVRGRHHLDVEILRIETTIVVHLRDEKLTHIYQMVAEDAAKMTGADDRLPSRIHSLVLGLGHGLYGDAGTPHAGLQLQYAAEQVMGEIKGLQIVVMIVQGPYHHPKPLAHVHLEDTGGDVVLPSHAAPLHRPDQGIAGAETLPLQSQGHVLVH